MGFRANASPSNIVSGSFGVEVITLDGSGLGQGADQPCREVTVWPEASKSIKIGRLVNPPVLRMVALFLLRII